MHGFHYCALFVLTAIILCQHLALSERRCRCLSLNATCWPNTAVWQNFNASVQGRLVAPRPSAWACNSNPPNANACAIARDKWVDSVWRSNQVGAMQNHNWENSSCSVFLNSTVCKQGSVPILAVNASTPEHIQATLQLVNTYNLRLVIKTTGHDYLGRSTASGALLLWLHHMKNITLMNNWALCTGENVSNVVRVSAGAQWGEVYRWLAAYNRIVIGGASSTVGATGGFLQGGGHGPLTRWQGMAADQVLEFDVILADGRRQTVNACQNSDLFWALRGGGAGTFAVVLSAVLRTYPSPSIIGGFQFVAAPNNARYESFVQHFVRMLPVLADAGWSSYFYFAVKAMMLMYFLPNGNASVAQATISQVLSNYSDLNFTQPYVYTFPSFIDFFSTFMESSNPTGGNVLLGSRLIPESIVRNQSAQVADVFFRVKDANDAFLIGHLVAGGNVSTSKQNNSVHPAWRTALLHMVFAQNWNDSASAAERDRLAKLVTEKVALLQTIAGGAQSAAYMNEADATEADWQAKFFGPRELYSRLKAIKDQVDPNGLFTCPKCVGSEDWTDDLSCPTKSGAAKPSLLLAVVSTVVLLSVSLH